MKPQDLQKVGLMISAIVWLTAMKLPLVAFCLAMFIWPAVLAFDYIERGNLRRKIE